MTGAKPDPCQTADENIRIDFDAICFPRSTKRAKELRSGIAAYIESICSAIAKEIIFVINIFCTTFAMRAIAGHIFKGAPADDAVAVGIQTNTVGDVGAVAENTIGDQKIFSSGDLQTCAGISFSCIIEIGERAAVNNNIVIRSKASILVIEKQQVKYLRTIGAVITKKMKSRYFQILRRLNCVLLMYRNRIMSERHNSYPFIRCSDQTIDDVLRLIISPCMNKYRIARMSNTSMSRRAEIGKVLPRSDMYLRRCGRSDQGEE